MANVRVSIINASTVLTDAEIGGAIPALQMQVNRDFAPVWGIDADLIFVPSGKSPGAGTWWLTVLDNSDQAGALGYHDVTSEGLPLGKVFAKSDLDNGYEWTVTFSHELLEMLGDPDINLSALVQSGKTSGVLYAYEVCDACEDDQFGYSLNGVLVSDFVYPSWFESFWQSGQAQFDHQSKIDSPFKLLSGGYIGIFDISAGTGWHQITAENAPCTYQMRPRLGSRRERRRIPRDQWVASRVFSNMIAMGSNQG